MLKREDSSLMVQWITNWGEKGGGEVSGDDEDNGGVGEDMRVELPGKVRTGLKTFRLMG